MGDVVARKEGWEDGRKEIWLTRKEGRVRRKEGRKDEWVRRKEGLEGRKRRKG